MAHNHPIDTEVLAMLAERFLLIGGRLMIDPWGRFLSAIDMAHLFERTWPHPQDPAPFEARRHVARIYDQAERRHTPELMQIVRDRGKFTANGWLVWEAV